MPSTPSERLPEDARFYRAFSNMPSTWQEVFDGILLSYRYPSAWKNDESGITPEEAAADWEQLIARFYLSEICQAIADCIIETTEDEPSNLPEGLFNLFTALNTYNATYGQNPVVAGGVVADNDVIFNNCDDDILFGAASQFVAYLNRIAVDMLERVDAVSQSTAGLLAEIGEAAPEFLDLDVLSDFLEWLTETLLANYNAAYTTTVEDELRCSLYCWWKERDCSPTLDNVREWIATESAIDLSPGTQPNVVWQSIVNITSGKALVTSLWSGMIVMSWVGALFWSMPSRRQIKASLNAMQNDPDSDWQTLCDPCGCTLQELSYDFRLQSYTPDDWQPRNGNGSWTSGSGWRGNAGIPFGTQMVFMRVPLGDLQELTRVTGEFSAAGVTVDFVRIYDFVGPDTVVYKADLTPLGSDIWEWTGNLAFTNQLLVVAYGDENTVWFRNIEVDFCEV